MNETVKIWTDLSESDLNSARLLYDNGHFRTSYFFFQQATEKANKAFALLSGLLSDKELKDIQHDQLKIYRKTIVKQESEIKSLIEVLKPYPKITNHELIQKTNFVKYHSSLSEGLSFIDSLRNIDLVNVSTNDLNTIIRELRKLKQTKLKFPKDIKQVFKKQFLEVADWIGHFETQESLKEKNDLINLLDNEEQSKQFYDLMIYQILPMIIEIAFANMTLFFCALITVQHSSMTRYPENNINPETVYNLQLPIVKKQPLFMDLLKNSIIVIKKLNEA